MAALVLIPVAISAAIVRVMIGRGALDMPGMRSSHATPTPRGGGLGPVAVLCIVLVLVLVPGPWRTMPPVQVAALLAAIVLLAAVSHHDDVRQGHFRSKLAAQLGAAAIVTLAGVMPPHPAGFMPTLLAAAAGCAWLVFATNAMNFIDGLNGLASGAMLLAAAVLAAVAGRHTTVGLAAAALAAGLAGFLPFNYPKARIFMGDVGSQPCGFAVAALGLALSEGGLDAASLHRLLLMPALLFGIYYDVLFTLLRRARAGERLTQAHRGHLYQLAQRSFMPATLVSAVQFGFVGLGALTWAVWPHATIVACLLLVVPQLAWTALVLVRAKTLLA